MAQGLAMAECIRDIKKRRPEARIIERWGHYTYWLAQRELESPKATYRGSRAALRARVTNRLLYEGEHADEPQVRILALSKLLTSCDTIDKADRDANPVDASTEEAVREELRNPSARLIELMIDEWCGGSSTSTEISLDADGLPPRPPIAELVRRLLPHWEDVLLAEGWVRGLPEPCEP